MEDSLSSSYDGPKARKQRHRPSSSRNSSRGGPEGDSMGIPLQLPTQHTSTPANVTSPKKKKKTKPKQQPNSDSDYNETTTPSPRSKSKRKSASKAFEDGDGNSFGSMDSKRSRMSSAGCSLDDQSTLSKKNKEKRKSAPPKTDLGWEMAVEKARGMPDGAIDSEEESDEMDADEIDVDAPPPPETTKGKSPKKIPAEKGKSNALNMIQCAAKRLKPKKSKGGSDSDSPNKATKRKSDDDSNEVDDKKKPKADKKDRKLQRKMLKNNYDVALQAKSMWEQLRRFDLTHEKRHQLSTDLYNLVKGKAKELIFAHDTSRVIQCMLKYGSQEHKNGIFEELREHIIDMAKSRYAKFFVRKLLKYGTKAQRNYVFRKLYGNVRKLIKHKEAAEIIECAYNDYANAMQRHALVEEFYGPSFALFKTTEQKSLDQIIQSNPEKRDSILSNMKEALAGLVEKSVLQYSIVHRVFFEFFSYATEKMKAEMIETVREGIIHMLHTREGARVAMLCIWHGTAKDRKVIVKSFKTYVSKICKEEYGHMVMLAMFDVVDDTKLVQKAMVDELLKSVHELAMDQYGRKVLLYLLCPRDSVHFHPDIVKILQEGDSNHHSKKDPELRRRELVEFVSRPLVQYISQHSKDLVTNNASLLLMLAIITHAKTDPTEAMRAVSQLAAEPFTTGSLENQHIVEHTAGHMTLKRLILNDAQRMQRGESVLFSGILLDILPEGCLKSWAACNRGCFVLIHLLELNHPEVTQKIRHEIVSIRDSLRKMDFKGAQTLLGKLGLS